MGGGGKKLEADKAEIILSGSVSGTLQPCVKFQVQGRVNEIKRKRNIKPYVRGIARKERTGEDNRVAFGAKNVIFQQPNCNKSFSGHWTPQSFPRAALLTLVNISEDCKRGKKWSALCRRDLQEVHG